MYSLRELLIVVVVLSAGCAALFTQEAILLWLFCQATVLMVGYAALHAVGPHLHRPFWTGFFIFGMLRFLFGAQISAISAEGLLAKIEYSLLETLCMRSARLLQLPFVVQEAVLAMSIWMTLAFATLGGLLAMAVSRRYKKLGKLGDAAR